MTRCPLAAAVRSAAPAVLLLAALGAGACRDAAQPPPAATTATPSADAQATAVPVMVFRGGYAYVFSDTGDRLAVVAPRHGTTTHGLRVELPADAVAASSNGLCGAPSDGTVGCNFSNRLVTVSVDGQDLSTSGTLTRAGANVDQQRDASKETCMAELTTTEIGWGHVPNLAALAGTSVKDVSWTSVGAAAGAQMLLRQGTITPLDGGYCWAVQPYDQPGERREIATAVRWTGPTAGRTLSFTAVHRDDPTDVAQLDVALRAGLVLSVQDTTVKPVTVQQGAAHPHAAMFDALLSSPTSPTALTCTEGISDSHGAGVRDCVAFTTPFDSCPPMRFTMPGA